VQHVLHVLLVLLASQNQRKSCASYSVKLMRKLPSSKVYAIADQMLQ
jgi:hypothetical protein